MAANLQKVFITQNIFGYFIYAFLYKIQNYNFYSDFPNKK
jgi:hypothetical protein